MDLKFFFIFSASSILFKWAASYLSLLRLSPNFFSTLANALSSWMHFSLKIDRSWFPWSLIWKIFSSLIFFYSLDKSLSDEFSSFSLSISALREDILLVNNSVLLINYHCCSSALQFIFWLPSPYFCSRFEFWRSFPSVDWEGQYCFAPRPLSFPLIFDFLWTEHQYLLIYSKVQSSLKKFQRYA